MTRSRLRCGYTTGACAAAAAKGAALMLRGRRLVEEVEITLPAGEKAGFLLHGQEFTENFASCFVVKDAGDDPDVTHGAEIHAKVTLIPTLSQGTLTGIKEREPGIVIEGGVGVGKVTKPGLVVPVGEWAINPVPRRMIEDAVREVFPPHSFQAQEGPPLTPHVTISIPNGEALAQKTLNARLGIIGGLSILGTSGIVRPISAKAWTDTIDAAVDVALACGCGTVVLSTGRTSELVAQKYLGTGTQSGLTDRVPGTVEDLHEEAFVMMGDHVGYALRSCTRKGVKRVVLAGQFAKLLKIACGHEQTHVSSSDLDLRTLAGWLELETRNSKLATVARQANTARHVLESSGNDPSLTGLVCGKVGEFAKRVAPALDVKVLLAGYGGEVLYFG
jgi:cobalt-precorrin-5B (C1)-methyltransferase